MDLVGRIIFISDAKKESNGKVYHNVNFESMDDGTIFTRVGATDDAVAKMRKYEKYNAHFSLTTWNGEYKLSIVDVEAIK